MVINHLEADSIINTLHVMKRDRDVKGNLMEEVEYSPFLRYNVATSSVGYDYYTVLIRTITEEIYISGSFTVVRSIVSSLTI